MEDLTWVIKYADTISIVTYLALTLVAYVLAINREWLVPGKRYREVCSERDELRDAAAERTERIERKLEIYEEAERLSRPRRRTSTSGSS